MKWKMTGAAVVLLGTAVFALAQTSTTISKLPLLGALTGSEYVPVEVLNPDGFTYTTKRAQITAFRPAIGAMKCPTASPCILLSAFLPPLQVLKSSTVPNVLVDLDTSISLSDPAWLEWRSGVISVGGSLAGLIATRYSIPVTGAGSMAALFTTAGL